ncbi:MAG: hypothetical protein QOG67_2299, partial [Verrucomicrobiota bacterium]
MAFFFLRGSAYSDVAIVAVKLP